MRYGRSPAGEDAAGTAGRRRPLLAEWRSAAEAAGELAMRRSTVGSGGGPK